METSKETVCFNAEADVLNSSIQKGRLKKPSLQGDVTVECGKGRAEVG